MSEEVKEDRQPLKIVKFEPRKPKESDKAADPDVVECDRLLSNAVGHLETVIIIGYTKDECEYYASSMDDGAEIVWLLERIKKFILDQADAE